jgi:predicted O-methyltransferase YrrM
MDLTAWLNFTSRRRACFDPVTAPIPGSPVPLSMLDALVERHIEPRGRSVNLLQIGTWCGISTIVLGRALQRVGVEDFTIYCVDIWHHAGDVRYNAESTDFRHERNVFNHEIFKFNVQTSLGWSHVVELIGDSRVSLKGLRDGFFDLIYVDGHHGYEPISSDIENAFRLCAIGGVICGDDYDCSPAMMLAIPDDAKWLDEYPMPPTAIGVHPGVVRAVDEALGVPRPYGSFWAFSKLADGQGPPFTDRVLPVDVPALPRRIPEFIPPDVRGRFEEHFAGPDGFLPDHPIVADRVRDADPVLARG